MFHYPAVEWTGLQAESIGIPWTKLKTFGDRDAELLELRNHLAHVKREYSISGIVSGSIESEYQKTRIDRVSEEAGLKSFAPLWRKKPKAILSMQIDLGFEILVTACAAMGLTEEWLGRTLDMNALRDLENLNRRYGIHIAFEGGEAETLVTNGPIFRKRLSILKSKKIWKFDSGHLEIAKAELQSK